MSKSNSVSIQSASGALVLCIALGVGASCAGSSTAAHTTPGSTNEMAVAPMSVHVETHASQGEKRTVPGASATLASSDDGIELGFNSSELTASHIYTVWVIAINNPSACASSPCTPKDVLGNHAGVEADVAFGAGAKADDSGSVSMAFQMATGEWTNSWFSGGLTQPTTAEIHLILNDHGPAIQGREHAMLRSYRDGCTDESLPPPFPATAKADGKVGPNKCALMQDAIFVQVP